MRTRGLLVLALLGAATVGLPADAWSQGKVNFGAMVWRHGTDMKVERATDFDGSDMTAQARQLEWDASGSGVGARVSYEFPRMLTIYGEAGTSQATVRDKDVLDPNQQVSSLGLNGGGYFSFGAQIGDSFSPTSNSFWSIGGSASQVNTSLDRDVDQSWDYNETRFAADFKVGTWVKQVGLYGGLRVVQSNADLKETDRTNPPALQERVTELSRNNAMDLLLGAQMRATGTGLSGFTEIGVVGSFSAAMGLMMRF